MKKLIFTLHLLSFAFLTACASGKYATNKLADKNNKVELALKEQIKKTTEGNPEEADIKESISYTKENIENKESNEQSKAPRQEVDYDLTKMNSDMVYASVYQLMVDPNTYVGKTFKMKGTYYSTFYEPTNKYYHYLIIEDAAACCAQGIEFIWDDGSHIYPDEYPNNEAQVEVSGTFETYKEGDDERLYCRINNAAMKVLDK